MIILKFGGTSLENAGRISRIIDIIKERQAKYGRTAVVVSALGGVTDDLIRSAQLAAKGDRSYSKIEEQLEQRHLQTVRGLIPSKAQSSVLSHIISELNDLHDVLHGVYLVRELSARVLDFVMSFGERLSAYILSEALNERGIAAEYLDARQVVKTNDRFGSALVQYESTFKLIRQYFESRSDLQIVTGFIGSTMNNETTTLGRGGSDFTASIFGAALQVKEIQIWTDVNGVLTADPQKVPEAFTIPQLTYEEAMELSHFGAKVVHPSTMQPALDKKIPIRIKNTLNPSAAGTLIGHTANDSPLIIKGLSSVDDVALINVIGSGMVGVAGIAGRIFGALARKGINVILISQASSEHSVCFAVLPHYAQKAKKAIEAELRLELYERRVNRVAVEKDLAVIAAVGENMRRTKGIAGKVFQALGKNGVNIVAIAQGSSELNISMVISKKELSKALKAIHSEFFFPTAKVINLYLAGTGLIGGTLLDLIAKQTNHFQSRWGLQIRLAGLMNSCKMLLREQGIDPTKAIDLLNAEGHPAKLKHFIGKAAKLNLPNGVFVDCTASDDIVNIYPELFRMKISVVTANKKANSGTYDFYLKLREAAKKGHAVFAYETNVGAGLPVIKTIRDLVTSGDRIHKIEGLVSGTLSFLFSAFTGEKPFSSLLHEAKEKGFTEPDPREDLNGLDAARKIVILAREAGYPLELEQVEIQNLVPKEAEDVGTVEEFFAILKKHDGWFEERRQAAENNGCKLCYVAFFESGKARVGLKEVDPQHPFFNLSGSDNVFVLTTDYYSERPLIIRGPGAGAKVTAAGVLSDILRAAQFLA